MKKIIYSFIMLVILFYLAGCESSTKFTDQKFKKIVDEISKDNNLRQYIESFDYKAIDKDNVHFDLTGIASDKFDKLTPTQQYQLVIHPISKLIKKYGGSTDAMNNKDESSDLFCGEGLYCDIRNISLKTTKHSYYTEYQSDILDGGYIYLGDKGKYHDEVIYDSDGNYLDIPIEEAMKLNDKEQAQIDQSSSDGTTINGLEPDLQTATGNDWVKFNHDEKLSLVEEAITNISQSGDVQVKANADWFIDALDAYWKNAPTSEKVTQIMSMTGVASGTIK